MNQPFILSHVLNFNKNGYDLGPETQRNLVMCMHYNVSALVINIYPCCSRLPNSACAHKLNS